MNEKPNVGSLFFGAFPSEGFLKATKEISKYFIDHIRNSCKLYQRIPGNF